MDARPPKAPHSLRAGAQNGHSRAPRLEGPRGYLVLVATDDASGQRVFALLGEENVLGRAPTCSVHVPNDGVPRRHARVTIENDEYWLEDVGSRNGTFLNG